MLQHAARLALLSMVLALPAQAQTTPWRYSPLPGEGDRASIGCTPDSDEQDFACLVVRCEDDFSTGIYIHTSRPEGDAGRWNITIDKATETFDAATGPGPYGARVTDKDDWLIESIEQGGLAYLEPLAGSLPARNGISLMGSLYAIAEALAFCAPKVE